MQVLLPAVGRPPYATLYLLHGLSDDSTAWLRRSRIEVYVRDLPLIVVMPDGYRGFYTDHDDGPAFARHFGEELLEFVERNFPAKPVRGARAVGGLSMGGYGAVRVALRYPEQFISANSHSGAVMHGTTVQKDPEFRRVFGKLQLFSSASSPHVRGHGRRSG